MTTERYKLVRDRIDEILVNFDFEKVHRIMELLDWTWSSWIDEEGDVHEEEIPSVYALRCEALRLMKESLDEGEGISTGGFRVNFQDNNDWFGEDICFMSLEFIAVEDSNL